MYELKIQDFRERERERERERAREREKEREREGGGYENIELFKCCKFCDRMLIVEGQMMPFLQFFTPFGERCKISF